MKKSVFALSACFIIVGIVNQAKGSFLSITISEHESKSSKAYDDSDKSKLENKEFWLAPSITFVGYIEETKTDKSQYGLIPGIGYGLRWNPGWWREIGASTLSKCFLSLDVYIQGSVIDDTDEFDGNDYFTIGVVPAITFFDWVSVGYGCRWGRSLHDGLKDYNTPILSFAVRKSF